MLKNKLSNRLEELFSTSRPVSPEPEHESAPVDLQGNGHDHLAPAPIPVKTTWEDFMDGIRRGEQLGYSYDQVDLKPLTRPVATQPDPDRDVLNANLRVGQDIIGLVQLEEKDNGRWSVDEAELVNAVVQRLAQQVDNLRLIEEANRFREEAENAVRRLTRQSWIDYLSTADLSNFAFTYDQNQVQPVNDPTALQGAWQIPIQVQNQQIGAVIASDLPEDDPEKTGLVKLAVERLSGHLESLRLSEQREQALAETSELYGLSGQLALAQTLQEILAVVTKPSEVLGAVGSQLFIHTHGQMGVVTDTELRANWQIGGQSTFSDVGRRFPIHQMAFAQLFVEDTNREPLFVEDVASAEFFDARTRAYLLDSNTHAIAVLPLMLANYALGIVLIKFDRPHSFSRTEKRLLSALSSQASVVVNNQLLLEQTRRRAAELETVAQVSTAASRVLLPQDLLQSVVDLAQSGFGLHHAEIYLLDADGLQLEIAAGSGLLGAALVEEHRAVALSDEVSSVARAARSRNVITANNLDDINQKGGHALLPDSRSELSAPMILGDRLLGVFNVQSAVLNYFSGDEARTFSTLASQVAVALQNARLYEEQAATVARLRELDHLKSSFLANMSHELRTPLNSILGFVDVILLGLDGPLTDTMVNDLNLVQKNSRHLLSLINDVLDMAKIEAGKMNLNTEMCNLAELLRDSVDITMPLAREKGLEYQIDAANALSMTIMADRTRLRQIFINVLGNAIKFTEAGGVYVTVSSLDADRVCVLVRDTGIGIGPDKQELIFEMFGQVDTTTTRKVGGTGLGLPISRRLVEMMGGRLWVESTGISGEGSQFHIELPLFVK